MAFAKNDTINGVRLSQRSLPVQRMPIRTSSPDFKIRHITFDWSATLPKLWHSNDSFLTHLFDAASLLFPVGERFFIDSVREWQAQITDPALLAHIRDFIGQEATHSQAHVRYNNRLREHGYDVDLFEKKLKGRLDFYRRYMPAKNRLASVLAYEHFTAMLADATLRDAAWLEGAHPTYAALWRWHAVEETEHKGVAYDLYQAIGGGYFRRVFEMALTTFFFTRDLVSRQAHMIRRDGKLGDLGMLWRGFKYLWLSPGIFLPMIPFYFRYYSPWFHPWQHNNTDVIEAWKRANERAQP